MRGVNLLVTLLSSILISVQPTFAQETDSYSYDPLGRMYNVAKSGGTNNGQATAIAYDPAGNRANYAITGAATAPALSIAAASANEGSPLSFVVTRSGSTTGSTSASWATSNGTAVAGTNYTAATGTVNFAPGVTSVTVSVLTTDDHVATSNLTMSVTLSAPSPGAFLGTASAVGTIVNTDANSVTLSIGPAGAFEGQPLSFTVTRSGSTASAASAQWATSNGTALAGTNYVASSGTVNIAAGASTGTITVSTMDDCVVTSTKSMYVTLSSPSGGVAISGGPGTGQISNKDKINCN